MKLKHIRTFTVAILSIAAADTAMSADAVPGLSAQPAGYFYTGKPYDDDLGAYVFAYRSYSPQLGRWTSTDPSGFPDGANNSRYAPVPTIGVDPLGLEWLIDDSQRRVFMENWQDPTTGMNYKLWIVKDLAGGELSVGELKPGLASTLKCNSD